MGSDAEIFRIGVADKVGLYSKCPASTVRTEYPLVGRSGVNFRISFGRRIEQVVTALVQGAGVGRGYIFRASRRR